MLGAAACRGSEPETVPLTLSPPPATTPIPTAESAPSPTAATVAPPAPSAMSPSATTPIPTAESAPAPTAATVAAPAPSVMPTPATAPIPTAAHAENPTPAPSPYETISPEDGLDHLLSLAGWGTGALQSVVVAEFTPSELACLESGLESMEQIVSDQSLSNLEADWIAFSKVWASCVELERDADILIATLESQAGRLSAETKQCIRDILFENSAPEGVPRMYALQRSSFQSSKCFSDEVSLEFEVSYFAQETGGLTDAERDCVRRVVAGGNTLFGSLFTDYQVWSDHPAYDCLSDERLLELKLASFAEDLADVTDSQLNCARHLFTLRGRAGGSRDNGDLAARTGLVLLQFIGFTCLSDKQLISIYSDSGAEWPDSDIQCLHRLFAERFPVLYLEEIGPRMFGDSDELSPDELESLKSFSASSEECLSDE